jgi:hypothetical protein
MQHPLKYEVAVTAVAGSPQREPTPEAEQMENWDCADFAPSISTARLWTKA